jgi:hypothetical protein
MTRHDLVELISSRASAVVPRVRMHQFAAHEKLQDMGANSVDRAEISMLVLESLDLRNDARMNEYAARSVRNSARRLRRVSLPPYRRPTFRRAVTRECVGDADSRRDLTRQLCR